MKTSLLVAAFTALIVGSLSEQAEAQRLRFPTSASASPTTTYVPFQNGAQPYQSITANSPIFMAAAPGAPGVTLGSPQPFVNSPPTFDAYAQPGGMATQPYVQQPYTQPGLAPAPATGWGANPIPSATGQFQFVQPNGVYATVPRFLQQMRVRHTWLKGSGGSATKMGMNSTEVDGTFLFPLFYLKDPFLLTPGFAVHFTEGPVGNDPAANLPSRLYDAYVDLGWQPVMTQWLKADLGIRVGAYSDFQTYTSKAWRILGRGMAVWSHSNTMEFRAGVMYLDRVSLKLIPAGGVIWMPGGPQGDIRWDFLFPNPKFSQRLTYLGTWDLWWYIAGELGGGSWSMQRMTPVTVDEVEYQDYRLITGLEWTTVSGVKGFIEAGWAFSRELKYQSGAGNVSLGDTFMLRGGVTF